MEELGVKIEGAERDSTPIGKTTVSTNLTPQSSQGLNHGPKSTHGPVHYSRGLPLLALVKG